MPAGTNGQAGAPQTGDGNTKSTGQGSGDGEAAAANTGRSVGDVTGISSWVSHYLNSKESDAPAADPVDSDANAGVNDVGQQASTSGEHQEAGNHRNLTALRGPIPILVFTALALGGVGTVLARTSKTLSHKKHEQ
ncbi:MULTISPECIES: hypothetical protein [Micrococcaceae]|uniref:hypothetical protein n=1 Tax=unclassified Kocuria TaxID=2649579 RepID=UPI00101212EE|nr:MULTISPECIES: hypothetical protein [unclassified Kocuria]